MQSVGNDVSLPEPLPSPVFQPASYPVGSRPLYGTELPHSSRQRNRVLFIATSRADGGIERYSLQMAAELTRRGVPLSFACRPGGAVEQACRIANIPTQSLSPRNSGDVRSALQLAALLSEQAIDIVHVHSRRDFLPTLFAVRLARRRGLSHIKLMVHAHMVRPLGTPPALSARLFAGHVDSIVCVSDAVRDILLRSGDLPASKVCTLHNGIDVGAFVMPDTQTAQTWRSELRQEWDIPPDGIVAAMIGRLDAKGQATLIQSLPVLSARFPALRVVLVGAEGIAGERNRLLKQARARHVADKIIFTGPRNDVPRVLAASDVLLHLPIDEAFGLVLAEAMASGLPIVTSDAGGCPEVVQNGVTGIVVPSGDLSALNAALDSLLCGEAGRILRIQMGTAGRAATESLFSFPHQMDALQELYAALCPASPLQ